MVSFCFSVVNSYEVEMDSLSQFVAETGADPGLARDLLEGKIEQHGLNEGR